MNNQIRKHVLQILKENPHTRNSDALLILEVYRRFYYMQDPVSHQKLLEIMRYESPDGICRLRRQIQSPKQKGGGKYRADEVIENERFQKVEEVREQLGYPNYNNR
jgi:hypothetical protein